MVRLYDAYGWFAFRDGHSLADCWILIYIIRNGDADMLEQSYKERICEYLHKCNRQGRHKMKNYITMSVNLIFRNKGKAREIYYLLLGFLEE